MKPPGMVWPYFSKQIPILCDCGSQLAGCYWKPSRILFGRYAKPPSSAWRTLWLNSFVVKGFWMK
jgi:hypothetical protein